MSEIELIDVFDNVDLAYDEDDLTKPDRIFYLYETICDQMAEILFSRNFVIPNGYRIDIDNDREALYWQKFKRLKQQVREHLLELLVSE